MKKILLLLLTTCILSCATDDSIKDPKFKLPPETQTGANTFGVTINGKVYIPRDPIGFNWAGPESRGLRLSGGGIQPYEYTEIIVVDGASSIGFKLTVHIQNLITTGIYNLKQSNFQDQTDSILENHAYFKIWDNNIKNYAYYGSVENQSTLEITRLSNGIVSGKFEGKFFRYDNPEDFILINDGRFDINSFTIQNTIFP